MVRLCILGGGLGCLEVLPLISRLKKSGDDLRVEAILDDDEAKWGRRIEGIEVVGPISLWENLHPDTFFVHCIGTFESRAVRQRLVEKNKLPLTRFRTIVDPSANVMIPEVDIGHGCIIYAGVTIMPLTRIGNFVVLSPNTTVGVGNHLADFSLFAAGVSTGTDVSVGELSFIGTGSTIAPKVSLAQDSFVGVGSVVFNDVAEGHKVLGNPARVIGSRAADV